MKDLATSKTSATRRQRRFLRRKPAVARLGSSGGALLFGLFLARSVAADYPVASHRYLADPAALVHDGRVYVYCSNDDDNVLQNAADDGYRMASLVAVSSADMKNWTDHGEVIRVPRDASWAVHTWAPAAIERNGTFYLYFANNASNIGVASSNSPTGPFTDARGSSLVNGSTPGASGPNMWLFDPAVFIDRDGQAYLYFGGNGESNGRVIRLNQDMVSVSGSATAITLPNFFEALWMHERNGVYYLSYSTTPAAGMRIDYMTSSSPTSGFSYRGIAAPQPPSNNNNNHAAIFELDGAWYLLYHNRYVATQAGQPTVYRRNLGVEPLRYNTDGTIVTVTHTRDSIEQIRPLDPYARVEAETFHAQSGIETEPCQPGGMNLAYVNDGDWVRVRGVDFGSGAERFTGRVASATDGGSIELRLDALDGTIVGTCSIGPTGGWQEWTDTSCRVDGAAGVHDLYLVFRGGASNLFNVDYWQFTRTGAGDGGAADGGAGDAGAGEGGAAGNAAGGSGVGGGNVGGGGGSGAGGSGAQVGSGGAPALGSGGTPPSTTSRESPDDTAGCGCRSARGAPSGNALLLTTLLLAALALRRKVAGVSGSVSDRESP